MYEVFINKKNKPESVPVKEVSLESNLSKTTRERLMDESSKIRSEIIERDSKTNIKRVEKDARNENYEKRTLRELESKFQNKVLRIFVGRNRFFHKKSISKDQEENLYSATRTAFDFLVSKDSHNYANGIVKGINAVYERVSDVYAQANQSNENVVIGTDDYLDSAHEIDLLEFYDNQINLTQVKNSSMSKEDVESIHQKHRDYFDIAHKHSFEYMHTLIDTHTKDIENKTEENPELYSHMKSIHDFLEWVKIYYDEKYEEGETEISDSFLEDCAEMHKDVGKFNFGYTDMSLIFQKCDVLHNTFMMDPNGQYNKIFNKMKDSQNKLPKKYLVKIKNEGVTSMLYNRSFFDKILESKILDGKEEFELERYMDMMRALDVWSINRNEKMTNREMRVTYKKYQNLVGIDVNKFIETADNIQSVVVHGGIVDALKLSKNIEN